MRIVFVTAVSTINIGQEQMIQISGWIEVMTWMKTVAYVMLMSRVSRAAKIITELYFSGGRNGESEKT